ncbi:MAG: Pup--protein ligase [Actinobacteria bacterium]|nr:Pup--protein ligase [Actinomycetota bacterium]
MGLETEYGVTCVVDGQRRLSPDEVARYLFRKVVVWGRSSNVFLPNGGRLYLDVGSHPEYATAECDNLSDLIKQDQAGDRIVEELAVSAETRLNAEGIKGQIHLFKNNMDAAGNSYGCHENFSVSRKKNFEEVTESIIPFLITRQIFCGAGKWISSSKGANFQISQRAEHMWESVSSATTRSRPIINTRDEPHADPDEYRRLHIIVGDSNMSETTTVLKVATTELMLRAAELGLLKDKFTIENPIKTIREISNDLKFRNSFRLSSGREITALQMQNEMYNIVSSMPGLDEILEKPFYRYALNLWRRSLDALESQDFSLVDLELDWMIKRKFMNSYKEKHQLNDMDSRLILLDISFHNIRKDRGLFYILEKSGMAKTLITNNDVNSAMENPPETTRAALRGRFIKVAQEKKRDFTVDWVNLKINDQQQSSIACKDPFKNTDERVDKLIAAL